MCVCAYSRNGLLPPIHTHMVKVVITMVISLSTHNSSLEGAMKL